MKAGIRTAVLIMTLWASAHTHAWFDAGHMISSWIAWEKMTPKTRAEVQTLLDQLQHQPPNTRHFVEASTWMDGIKDQGLPITRYWHTIGQDRITEDVKGPDHQHGVWVASEAIKTLSNPKANDFTKAFMLRALMHIAQDLHSPLHVCDDSPDGNPEIRACYKKFLIQPVNHGKESLANLARLWDAGVLAFPAVRAGEPESLSIVQDYGRQFLNNTPAQELPSLTDENPMNWAKESLKIRNEFALSHIKPGQPVSETYLKRGQDYARQRIVTAGYRLAAVLNRIFDHQEKAEIMNTEPPLSSGIYLENFDKTVRPQDDFYSHVNGGWLQNTEIPDDQIMTGAFKGLDTKAIQDVNAIIEELLTDKSLKENSNKHKIAALYASMLDIQTINALGITPLQQQLDDISALGNHQQIFDHFAVLESIGVSSPFSLSVFADMKNTAWYALYLSQSGLSLPDRDFYLVDNERFQTLRTQLADHITNMFALAGLPNGSKAANTVLTIETELARNHWTRVESRDREKTYNQYSTADLNQLTSDLSWKNYLDNAGVAKLEEIIIKQPSYLEGFNRLFMQYSTEQWQTYLTWRLLSQYASLLGSNLDQEHFDFFEHKLRGQQQQKERWKRAVERVNHDLGDAVGKLYVSRHYSDAKHRRMMELVENLRKAYAQSIDELEWMSKKTKEKAKIKLASFTPKIGYPDQWRDYSGLTINKNDLVGNVMRARAWAFQDDMSKLFGPVRQWEWYMNPQTVNAYYYAAKNEIVFPAAILQPPFFNIEADDAVNYGGIGAVIGHEMGHGFDDQGSKHDDRGNLKNWWTPEDKLAFDKRGNKLVKQFNSYRVFPDLNVNGELTLGENIGDLSGLTIAMKAYHLSLQDQPAPVIDGYTGIQRVLIGFAQIWCTKLQEEEQRNRIRTDPHSPTKFRTNGSVVNVPEFYDAFNVQPDDGMYIPEEDRVKIW